MRTLRAAPLPALPGAPWAALPGAVLLGWIVNFACDGRLPGSLADFCGKTVAFRVTDLKLRLCLRIRVDGFQAAAPCAGADVTISASAADFGALALRKEDADTLFFSRHLSIEGDTELGVAVKNVLDALPMPSGRALAPHRVLRALRTCLARTDPSGPSRAPAGFDPGQDHSGRARAW